MNLYQGFRPNKSLPYYIRRQVKVVHATTSIDKSAQEGQFKNASVSSKLDVVEDTHQGVIQQLEQSYCDVGGIGIAPVTDVDEQVSDIESEQVGEKKGLWALYSATLAKYPVPMKSATSFIGFGLGDILSQTIMGGSFDASRLLRMMLFGMMMDGPIGHVWYTTLDTNVFPEDPTSTKAVITKTALDQLVWAPFFSCVFFCFINLLKGQPDNISVDISTKLVPMLLANFALWPLAHIINFKFVPSQQRILYINVVSIFWCAYLSYTANHNVGGGI